MHPFLIIQWLQFVQLEMLLLCWKRFYARLAWNQSIAVSELPILQQVPTFSRLLSYVHARRLVYIVTAWRHTGGGNYDKVGSTGPYM